MNINRLYTYGIASVIVWTILGFFTLLWIGRDNFPRTITAIALGLGILISAGALYLIRRVLRRPDPRISFHKATIITITLLLAVIGGPAIASSYALFSNDLAAQSIRAELLVISLTTGGWAVIFFMMCALLIIFRDQLRG